VKKLGTYTAEQVILAVDELLKSNLAPLHMRIHQLEQHILDIKEPLRHSPAPPKCVQCDHADIPGRFCWQWRSDMNPVKNPDGYPQRKNCGRTVNGEHVELEWEV